MLLFCQSVAVNPFKSLRLKTPLRLWDVYGRYKYSKIFLIIKCRYRGFGYLLYYSTFSVLKFKLFYNKKLKYYKRSYNLKSDHIILKGKKSCYYKIITWLNFTLKNPYIYTSKHTIINMQRA